MYRIYLKAANDKKSVNVVFLELRSYLLHSNVVWCLPATKHFTFRFGEFLDNIVCFISTFCQQLRSNLHLR